MRRIPASFRDPDGTVYDDGLHIWRAISESYKEEWSAAEATGLFDAVRDMLVPWQEVPPDESPLAKNQALYGRVWKTLRVRRVPFISYPYEWCFSSLKDAALLTLSLHKQVLKHGFILKDASAYNIQFVDGEPVFIDLLSFERWKEGQAWQAYGQFCRHFLAPLALMARRDLRMGLLTRQWIDGIPLDLAASLLPWQSRFSPSLAMHIHMHAGMQKRYADARKSSAKVSSVRLDKTRMLDVADSLESAIRALTPPAQKTEWGNYYSDTNYSPTARAAKENAVRAAAVCGGGLALDLGANTGEFSRLLTPHFSTVLATDFDPLAVELHYASSPGPGLQPLLLDATNPSPGTGWGGQERESFEQRCDADYLQALALCHHLFFTFGIPFSLMASWFKKLLKPNGRILAEFVPKEDSQVRRLLANRDDVFPHYSEDEFVNAFLQENFIEEERTALPETCRTLHLFRSMDTQ